MSQASRIKARRAELEYWLETYRTLRRSLGDVNRLQSPMKRMFQAGHMGALGRVRGKVLRLMLAQRIDLINYRAGVMKCKS